MRAGRIKARVGFTVKGKYVARLLWKPRASKGKINWILALARLPSPPRAALQFPRSANLKKLRLHTLTHTHTHFFTSPSKTPQNLWVPAYTALYRGTFPISLW